jgi:hypothetical protein
MTPPKTKQVRFKTKHGIVTFKALLKPAKAKS